MKVKFLHHYLETTLTVVLTELAPELEATSPYCENTLGWGSWQFVRNWPKDHRYFEFKINNKKSEHLLIQNKENLKWTLNSRPVDIEILLD